MIRTFHSVGQGALYSEDFGNFTMVYDCGSYKNTKLIKDELRNSFSKKQVIDAVFISHFHEDHINGLEFLLTHCHVKYLFIPFLTDIEKMVLVVENATYGTRNPFIENIILNPEETITNTNTQIVSILPSEEVPDDGEISLIDNLNFPTTLQSGSKLSIGGHNWVLVPFHFRRKEKTEQFKELLNISGIKIKTTNDLLAIIEDNSKYYILEQCYKDVKGTLNSNSLVLYSGPETPKDQKPFFTYSFTFKQYFPSHYHQSGCVYFGDYDASGKRKWKELDSSFSKYWVNVGSIQVPHHGSCHNYNIGINDKQPLLSILSCGEKNHFRHPHGSVVKHILKNDGYPLIVTEKPHSRVFQEIQLI